MSEDEPLLKQVGRKKPWLLKQRSSKGVILLTVCAALFTDSFLYGVIIPVIPFSLRDRSGVSDDDVQWWASVIFGIFGLATLIGSPFCGWLADRSPNRQGPLLVGLVMLGVATLLLGVARAPWVLLISRLLQGLSNAVVYSVGLALIADTVRRDEIGTWMGAALSASSMGLIVSPLLGGIVYAKAGYDAVFGMSIGLIGLDILLRLFMIEKKTAALYDDTLIAGERQYGTESPNSEAVSRTTDEDASSRTSSIGSPNRVEQELQAESISDGVTSKTPKSKEWKVPLMLTLLSSPRLLACLYGIFVQIIILGAFDGILPLFLERTFKWDSFNAGLIFLCLAGPASGAAFVGKASDRFGARWIAVIGFTLATPPLILLRLVEKNTKEQEVLLCVLLTLIGCALVFIDGPMAADMSFVVEQKEKENPALFSGLSGGAYAQTYALFNVSMAAATLLGPVVAGALVEQYGWKLTMLVFGVIAFSGNIPTILYVGGPLRTRPLAGDGQLAP